MFAFTSAPQQDVLTTTPLSMLSQVSTAGDVELEVDYGAQVQCLAWSPSSAQLAAGSPNPRNPRHFGTIEGGRVYQALHIESKSVLDALCRVKKCLRRSM